MNKDDAKAARKRLNLSTDELAHLMLISRRTLEGWESGRAIPGPAQVCYVLLESLSHEQLEIYMAELMDA